jgi:3-hydroxybutyrate dehydrogenase
MLQGKTAIVTGSVQGLGYAIAEKLAASGCGIMMSGLDNPDVIETQRKRLEEKHGVRVTYDGADFTRTHEIKALVDETVRLHGNVDILVNNAVYRHQSPVEDFPEEEWNRALAVNVSAPFHLIKHCLPRMRRAGWGRIINISSIRAFLAVANRVDYVTAKTAILGMTRAIAQEVIAEDITCNALCPGSLRTPHSERGVRRIMETKGLSQLEAEAVYLSSREPSGRFNELESVAAAVLFLCSPAGRDISGIALPIDNGRAGGEHSM